MKTSANVLLHVNVNSKLNTYKVREKCYITDINCLNTTAKRNTRKQ